ncbi:alkaline phosphatase family protein [Cladophialophora carrionii]|uniref:Alkaline phosphatase family protein n=1 Tax=Cladophialophora carrionii TaxID=86049 RepID=A0A1C1CBJ7_9EURO|nr:alkaline phosphatase family protein [Cladophialophora carrionii]
MPSTPEIVAATSSSILRLAAFVFLRWIPGWPWPPTVLTALAIYLTTVFGWSDAFGSSRPTLHEAFPRLFPHPDEDENKERDEKDAPTILDHDEPVLYEDEKALFKTLLFGIPNWRHPAKSYLTIAANVLLALCTLDLVFRGPLLHAEQHLSFVRVGYVDTTSAKVLIREPDPAQFPIYVYLSPADQTQWKTTDTLYWMGADTDYTHALTFDGLQPARKYIYSLSNDKSGTFTTAPAPYSDAANSLTFLTSSCIKANFPYRANAHSLAIHGFGYLSRVVRSLPSPASFMLFLGDFIYVDVPIRLSYSLAHYRAEYRRVYASPSWSLPGLDALPWIHTLDDHEIANDWSAGNETDPFPAASDPFIHYHVSVNPPVPPGAPIGPESNTTYFQFTHGPASFFMLDTRRYRTDPEPESTSFSPSASPKTAIPGSSAESSNSNPHSMLGAQQLSSLLSYLSTAEPPHIHWKIIASSVPFTKNWRFGTSDTWGGFLSERARILQTMHDAERVLGIRVIILSGDRHEFAAIRYPPPVISLAPVATGPVSASLSSSLTSGTEGTDTDTPIQRDQTPAAGPHEFSCGPLSMFYLPFRTFRQIDDEDVPITYIPDGNSKVGVVEIRNLRRDAGPRQSLLKYSLYVDGRLTWEYALSSPGASASASSRAALGGDDNRRAQGWRGWIQGIGLPRGSGSSWSRSRSRSLWE